jgi:hypothetical protein
LINNVIFKVAVVVVVVVDWLVTSLEVDEENALVVVVIVLVEVVVLVVAFHLEVMALAFVLMASSQDMEKVVDQASLVEMVHLTSY